MPTKRSYTLQKKVKVPTCACRFTLVRMMIIGLTLHPDPTYLATYHLSRSYLQVGLFRSFLSFHYEKKRKTNKQTCMHGKTSIGTMVKKKTPKTHFKLFLNIII
jgi:hypothetical protein